MRRTAAAMALCLVLMPAAATADHGGATVEWTGLLPAQPDVGQPGQDGKGCGPRGLRCLLRVERRLSELERRLGCDHRAVFATTRAWELAFDAAAHGDHNARQDMLLAISAHVQRDMPFAIVAVGLRTPDGRSRKVDHDAVNRVLSRAYDVIVPEIARRYDPFMARADASPSPLDDMGAQQLVAGWREHVWRNAERLSGGGTERATAEVWIGRNAASWAHGMAALTQPGYRAVRDAHCAAALGRQTRTS